MNAAVAPPDVRRKGPIVLAILAACFLVVMMDNTILNVALQTIQRDLHATNSQLQWAVDSYILVYAALMFSAGVLADSFGRRRVLVIGLLIFGVASALSAFSTTPEQLILWRSVMGVGGSVVPPATLAIINDYFPSKERGKAIGVWSAVAGLSIAFGPIIGGFLLERFWWGSVFLINVPVVAVCIAAMLVTVPESRAQKRVRLDGLGVLLSMLGTGGLVYGVIRGGETNSWFGVEVFGSIALGVVLLAVLVWFEGRAEAPALDVKLLRNRAFAAGTASISLSFFALTGGTFLLVFYVQGIRGYTPLELGLVLLPTAIGTVLSAVASNPLSKRLGARAVVILGLVLLIVSFVLLYWLTKTTPLWLLELALGVSGLGLGFVMGTTTTLVMSVVAADKAGVGAAVNNTLRQVGAALGVAVLGSVLSVRYRGALGSAVDVLPADLRGQASDSLGGTFGALATAQHRPEMLATLRTTGPALVHKAEEAYLSAMHFTLLVAAALLAVGVVIGLVWLPRGRSAIPTSPDR